MSNPHKRLKNSIDANTILGLILVFGLVVFALTNIQVAKQFEARYERQMVINSK